MRLDVELFPFFTVLRPKEEKTVLNVAALEIAAAVVRIPEESRRRTAEGLEGSGDAGQIGKYEEEEENEGAGRERWCKTEIQFHFIEYIFRSVGKRL